MAEFKKGEVCIGGSCGSEENDTRRGLYQAPAGWAISRRRACADRMLTATLVHDEQEFVVPEGCRCRSGGVFLFDQLEFALREGLPLSRLRRVIPGQRAVMHEDMPLSELQRLLSYFAMAWALLVRREA